MQQQERTRRAAHRRTGVGVRRLSGAVLLLGVLLGVLVDVGTARPAAAHATVTTTTPADSARLDFAPAEVVIEFDEPVSLGAGYARVLDGDGERVDTGAAEVRGSTLTVPLREGLPDAGYVVTYRVVSADSHPVSGAFSFAVGNGELVAAGSVGEGDGADPGVAVALPVARWLSYLGLTLGLGVPLVLATCWPGGWAVSRLRRLAGAGLAAVVVGGVLSLLLQGPYAAGSGLGSLVDPQLLGTTLDSTFGRTLLLRVVLAALLAAVLLRSWRRGSAPGTGWLIAAGVLAAALVVAVAAVGHPVAGPLPVLAVAVAAVHVAAMSAWLGGLVALFAGALRGPTPAGELVAALPRWSSLAAGCIGALVVTGVLQSVREVGSVSALFATTYGWVLVAKVALVLLVLVAALVGRDWVQQRVGTRRRPSRRVVAQAFAAGEAPATDGPATDGPVTGDPATEDPAAEPPATIGVLRRAVLLELVGAAVVLALSAVLVGTPPAKAAVAQPVEVTLPLQSAGGTTGAGTVQVLLDPATPGPTTLHVYLFDADGRLTQPQQIGVTLTEVEQEIGPLDVDLAPAGPGHYVGDPTLPTTGTWTLTATVRLDEFTAATASTVFPVR
ncbi:copper resistance CopC/CopD family protein [Modestobacter sp. VKM Ac-2978]|uniref:copper resistance CopC/CopD family protein n=1 Tax=Modestobacter sp. VKM Ac-2978 TaxID=3004132 RepID=UPI0022AB38F1|nr:copper resistance protein CopC [Modestobacter sp. VKM Ac-2978]MCZ2850219.1 copper resistance protein CopC [Modestobacter sp. VKM Ac-2978]